MVDLRNDATSIFDSAVSSALPSSLINKKIQRLDDSLIINNKNYTLNRNVKVVAFGKASVDFSKSIENLIGDHITEGIASVPKGILNHFNYSNEKIILREGAEDNLPDKNSEETTNLICQMMKNSSKEDIILVLISGGGSSLLSMPAEGIPSSDKLQTINLISQNGGDITQLNTVRKHISAIKGGQLSQHASPATVISLIISDVLDDSLDVIASGPTVPDSSTFGDALKVIHDLSLENKIPESVMERLLKGSLGELDETPKSVNNTDTFILGSNKDALTSAKREAESLGYEVFIHSSNVSGLARDVGLEYADLAKIDTQEEQGETSVHIFVAKKRLFPLQITMLEKHPCFSQTFIPKGNTPFLVVVSPPSEEPVIENIRAFISNGDQGISYSRGVWHFPLISINDNSQFIVIDRKHNIDTDTIKQCIVKRFEDTNITVELSL
mgnify:CR=1 FL=1